MTASDARNEAIRDEQHIREGLVRLARAFLTAGLVVRTWGNFSAKVDEEHFLVTPSGRSYHDMEPDELVKCRIEDGKKVEGESGKPSSEAPMHAIVYRRHPQYRYLAHTHQVYASALSLSRKDLELGAEESERMGTHRIPVSGYALPGTKKLHRHMAEALERSDGRFVLMARHGAFVFGLDPDDCLKQAQALEDFAKREYRRRVGRGDMPRADLHTESKGEKSAGRRAREEWGKHTLVSQDGELIHALPGPLRPYLDDFAQICGVKVTERKKKNNVILDSGARQAICVADSRDEAENVRAVLEKNVRARHIAELEGARPINLLESWIMRLVYQHKYSKKAKR